jgi:hypothetical protein
MKETEPEAKIGPDHPTHQWPEYRQLREAVNGYLNHEPDDPRYNDIWRALGAMLAEYQRDRFIDGWNLSEPAETACVRRLITGESECTCNRSWADRERETIGERDDPPHKPPHGDHATLWLGDDDNPAVYSMHIYPGNILNHHPSKTADPDQQQRNGWFDIVEWCAEWGLEISISSMSWYHPSAVQVVIYPPERHR